MLKMSLRKFFLSSNTNILIFGIFCTSISYSFGSGDFPENFEFILRGEGYTKFIYEDKFELIHNGTHTYSYVKDNKELTNLPANTEFYYGKLTFLHTDYNCSGNWQIKSDGISFEYTVLVVNNLVETFAIPSHHDIEQKIDERVNIHMPKITGATVKCFLLHLTHNPNEAILYNATDSDIKFSIPFYDCGVNMRIKSNRTGEWALVQLDDEYRLHYGRFYINDLETQLEKTFSVDSIIGTPYKFALSTFQSEKTIVNCELVNPHGDKVVLISTQCEFEVSKVSKKDAGNWTMFYDIGKKHTTHKIIVDLIVHEPKIETVIEKTNNSDINLLCSVKFDAKKQFCFFQHPNGTVYRNDDFLGKEKYQFHTNYSDPTTTIRNSKYCGMTIISPDDSDFGAWRCYMGIQKKGTDWNAKVGSILHVESSFGTEHSAIQHKNSDMHVRFNETFEILCTANKIVERCWLERPDRMIFEIKESKNNHRYKYKGRGFSMGDCGATIENANSEDTGDWKCIMKLMNDTHKIDGKISVTVTKNLVEAKQSVIIYTGSPITMSCVVIPNVTFDFDHCRWIKPNGYGVHFEYDQNYHLIHDHRECSLRIEDVNEEGNWICVVESRIMGQIATATVNIIIMHGSNLSLILCLLATGFCVLASCVTFFVCKKRIKYRRETDLQLK